MELIRSFETSGMCPATWRYNPEDRIFGVCGNFSLVHRRPPHCPQAAVYHGDGDNRPSAQHAVSEHNFDYRLCVSVRPSFSVIDVRNDHNLHGKAIAQLGEALCYRHEGRGFDS
jgi:hypothetical protein